VSHRPNAAVDSGVEFRRSGLPRFNVACSMRFPKPQRQPVMHATGKAAYQAVAIVRYPRYPRSGPFVPIRTSV
jgi:hypothetical protein